MASAAPNGSWVRWKAPTDCSWLKRGVKEAGLLELQQSRYIVGIVVNTVLPSTSSYCLRINSLEDSAGARASLGCQFVVFG